MKLFLFFLGGLVAVCILGAVVYIKIRNKLRRIFGPGELSSLINSAKDDDTTPKSLSGMDSIYLPQILSDFPDFDTTLAKTEIRKFLETKFKNCDRFKIHNVVINDYKESNIEKTIIYQASAQYYIDNKLTQHRYCVHYSFIISPDEGDVVSAVCPNCAAPLSKFNNSKCEYCNSTVTVVLNQTFKITEYYEK